MAAEQLHAELIWPTWTSIKIGPWVRREQDKRLYNDLFVNREHYLDGWRKYKALLLYPKMYVKSFDDINAEELKDNTVIICENYEDETSACHMGFAGLEPYRKLIRNTIVNNLGAKGNRAFQFRTENAIGIHVRCGDFQVSQRALDEGRENTRIPIDWYCDVVRKIRNGTGKCVPVKICSDGSDEELKQLLDMDAVERVTAGNSIGDIMLLSRFPLVIASGSTFSLWARFLGGMSSISYPVHMMAEGLCNPGCFEMECEAGTEFSDAQISYMKQYL